MKIALGLSAGSWSVLQRLKACDHVDTLALTVGAASGLEKLPQEVLIDSAAKILRRYWTEAGLFIFVGAIGAVTRLVAPLLISKEVDPAVLVMDISSKYVVPLLGGHKAGSEE